MRKGIAIGAVTVVTLLSPPYLARLGSQGAGIEAAAIEAHMRFLASDLLEGREAGTRGYDLAASYVAAQLRLIGLAPGGPDGSYFQPVPLQAHWLVRDGTSLVVHGPGGPSAPLVLGTDYVALSSPARASSRVKAAAVFVGYGIEAPALGLDDYAGLDVNGKVVVFLAGFPSSLPSEEAAHHGSFRQKAMAAARHGAIGYVAVYTPVFESVYPWPMATATIDAMSMAWIGPGGVPHQPAPGLQATAIMSPDDGAVLFEGAPRSYADVRAETAKGSPRGFPLAVTIELSQASRHERRSSANVVGVLRGSDPTLRDEYVVMVGHLDHEGIARPVNGDAIYNGALDNAAGIAAMLEAARALARQPVAPRRSIVFLAVTAEEKGLLGSEYFSLNPTVPRDALVAAVNLDMPVLLYDFTDVIAFGAQHSTLEGTARAALGQIGLTLTPDPMPEQAVFTRSDHYRFVERGIPSIFLATGWDSPAGKGEGGKAFTGFLGTHYHQPSDDLNLPIDYAAGAKFATANYLVVKAIADADTRPAWNAGDFFGNLFAKP